MLIAPVADMREGTPALFDRRDDDVDPQELTLFSVERRVGNVVWIRYRVQNNAAPL